MIPGSTGPLALLPNEQHRRGRRQRRPLMVTRRLGLVAVVLGFSSSARGASAFDANFACCGGCSSSKRSDAYNAKLANGAHMFIWDVRLKTNPAPACRATFPYDPALNEQIGDRRVRSGRLVGTSYPIDHDFDALCCEQRGECFALDEDASGTCHCVAKWGFTGDHCEFSVYDVATQNNTALFPPITNLSHVERLFPDLRQYLVQFDLAAGLRTVAEKTDTGGSVALAPGSLADVFTMHSYRQFAWTTSAYFVAGALLLLLLFLLQVCWSYCCFRCGCRKRDPRKQAKIYAVATKILWGLLMCIALTVAVAAAAFTCIVILRELVPRGETIETLLTARIPQDIEGFRSALLEPLDRIAGSTDPVSGLGLRALQSRAVSDLQAHSFLDEQTASNDHLGATVFAVLDQLANYSSLYPTVEDKTLDCANLNITPSIPARMTSGATTGCFRCKTCSLIASMLDDARDRWRRKPLRAQLDLRESRQQLLEFGRTEAKLSPTLTALSHELQNHLQLLTDVIHELRVQYKQLETEFRQITLVTAFVLVGLSALAFGGGVAALGHGLLTNKRPAARTTCFFAELATVVAVLLVGFLYTLSWVTSDGITALELLDRNMSVVVADEPAAWTSGAMLADRNLLQHLNMTQTLAFADTLRVPPHPTPYDDDPPRIDLVDLYDFPELFALERAARDLQTAREAMFGWDEAFVTAQHGLLRGWAFGNATVVSPYNLTIHQELLNSTAAVLMDPDNDTRLATDDDLAFIETTFNSSWRGVPDRGVAQNALIASQWQFVARLERQRTRLGAYLTTIADILAATHPLLETLRRNTSLLEDAEFQLKAPVEYVTTTLRAHKLRDCGYSGNCAWFRRSVNELHANLQGLITHAEFAAITCAVSFGAALFGVLFSGCFASRLRRNIVKVYSAK